MAVTQLTSAYKQIATTGTWTSSTGFEGSWKLYAKVDSTDVDNLKAYISVKMTISMNYQFRSDTSDDCRAIKIEQDGTTIYTNTQQHISDTKIDGIWGYYGNYTEYTVYEWKNIAVNCNSDGEFENLTIYGKFISYPHDVNWEDLTGECSLTKLDVGGKISIKTGSTTWSKGQVYVKTASNTWSKAKAIYIKTSDGWKKAK